MPKVKGDVYLCMCLFFLWKKIIFVENQTPYMFLKALQYKSAQKVLAKKLGESVVKEVNSKPIQTVGIIINADETANVTDIVASLKLNATIDILCYHKNHQKTRTLDYPVFYEKDFGWKGKARSEALQNFLEKPFDVLISYYNTNLVPLQLVSGLHIASFKVGISGSDQEIHDLIIQTTTKEIATFTKELHTYLHILNKL